MTSPSDAMPNTSPDTDFPAQAAAPAALSPTNPFLWSVRRELWENGSLWIAPVIAAGVVLFGFLIGLAHLPSHVPLFQGEHGERHQVPPEAPYLFVAFVIVVTAMITGIFYCLGALHNERRDRTILFWKSLPVSDLTTVLAKLFAPMVILPVATFVIAAATEAIIWGLSAVGAAASGSAFAAAFTNVQLVSMLGLLAYTLAVLSLWYAPVWGWCLLVGAWARRVPFLWAAGAPLALCVIEAIALQTSYVWRLLHTRLAAPAAAFSPPTHHGFMVNLSLADPVGFLTSPGLWIGLVFAAACIAAAVWLRRYRDPM